MNDAPEINHFDMAGWYGLVWVGGAMGEEAG